MQIRTPHTVDLLGGIGSIPYNDPANTSYTAPLLPAGSIRHLVDEITDNAGMGKYWISNGKYFQVSIIPYYVGSDWPMYMDFGSGRGVRCVTSKKPWWHPLIPKPANDGAYLLYFAVNSSGQKTDDILRLGKWGVDVKDIRQLAFFKFGSVIGLSNPQGATPDTFSYDDIWFNPTNLTVGSSGSIKQWVNTDTDEFYSTGNRLPGIPGYVTGDYPKLTSDRTAYHTLENIKVGRGDPCQLAGCSAADIRNMTHMPASNGWRSPTNAENEIFSGNSGSHTALGSTYWTGYYDCLTGAITTAASAAGVSFQFSYTSSGSRTIAFAQFPQGTPANVRTPVAGARDAVRGSQEDLNPTGWFFAAEPVNDCVAHSFRHYQNYIDVRGGTRFSHCTSIRCVPQ